jgi:hypothetical protein
VISLAFIVGGGRWKLKTECIKQIALKNTGALYWARNSDKFLALATTVIYI